MARYLVWSRHGTTWYLRIRVPAALHDVIGKREIRKSLGTSDLRLGKLRASALALQINEAFQTMRTTTHLVSAFFKDGGVKLEVQEPYTEKELQDTIRAIQAVQPAATSAPEVRAQKPFAECVIAYMDMRPTVREKTKDEYRTAF